MCMCMINYYYEYCNHPAANGQPRYNYKNYVQNYVSPRYLQYIVR